MSFTLPTDTQSRPVAVIGAGTLGRRIAMMFATRGGTVRLFDSVQQAGDNALAYIKEQLPHVAAGIKGGTPGTVVATTDLDEALADAWLVVEAIPERLDLKKEIFAELDRTAGTDTILASNSSSYPTSQFSGQLDHPERVLNMHFYMPPAMTAVDLMSSGHTDRGVFDLLLRELPHYGVFPFEAHRESTGFIFNRIWAAIKREALSVVAEGVSNPADIDAMWKINMGTPQGPFRLMDQVGLDVVLDIENHYAAENPHLPTGPRELLHRYVDAGHLGVKTGRGFYTDYTPTA
ncbi:MULTISPECIES: 3-hydroxyacyl-CoA dehydrogenase family protein [unclassified Streptomyces]|uniref:3-hydroxyacyl-CoA dehydrogenase family protein n=1 Tax=unclassified Streptomyces TaxID=2593676 RepID=UPI000DBA0F07|nr:MULTISPECIES: 3-hydroxyacyl-CoA dehydrogenase family protein [unclassified Streptomyces]MYT73479.1 3-hydroxyacyl-CoA dehydrogenase family protein [Streptomyces sp. SID8367]RAJ85011.1 3-hydroxybutyryl-CoA dehydrogenase [Streptomyces sp. PsTaAH-137]